MLNLLFSSLEDVYNSRFIDTAVGSSLYNLGRTIGLQLLRAQKSVGYLTFYRDDGINIPEGFLVEPIEGIQYITLQKGTITNGEINLPASAVVAGPDGNVPKDSINIITNPKLGITGVTNYKAFEGGRNTETDMEFRERYYQSVDFAGGVNLDAIIAEIYESVEAVIAVTGEENDKDTESSTGLPPHSIEIIVYGGHDEDIAGAIYKRKAAGIQAFGNTNITVTDLYGVKHDIGFSRPIPVNVWVKINNLVTANNFPLDGIEQIKQCIVAYIGLNTRGGLNIGQSVICITISAEVLKIPGIVDFELQISSDGENYSRESIKIAAREKAVTDENKVNVT